MAVLEIRVHLDLAPELIPDDYVLMSIDVSGLALDTVADLPPAPATVGDDWLRARGTPLLEVPSLLVPESRNCLLNPGHPEAAAARIVGARPFAFDHRLWLPLRPEARPRSTGEPLEDDD